MNPSILVSEKFITLSDSSAFLLVTACAIDDGIQIIALFKFILCDNGEL